MSQIIFAVECSHCENVSRIRTPLQGRCTICGAPFEDRAALESMLQSMHNALRAAAEEKAPVPAKAAPKKRAATSEIPRQNNE